MSSTDIPTEVKDFVFQFIDSVEQLEILLLIFSQMPKTWTADEINDHLRSNRNSVEKRLGLLVSQKLLIRGTVGASYGVDNTDEKIKHVLLHLAESYKVHKYGVLEMIFSPMKKSRDFADAFRLTTSKDDKGERNG